MAKKHTAAGKKPAKRPGLRAISVAGYKSLVEKQRVEMRPLTILAGANSSGKSSIMQPVLLLKQTLDAPYDPGSLLLDGPNVRLTSTDQILSKLKSNATKEFLIEFEIGDMRTELRFCQAPLRDWKYSVIPSFTKKLIQK